MTAARILPFVVTALVVGSSALAATTTPSDAKRLALREADFPVSVKRMSERENRSAPLPGGTGEAYTTTFQFRAGRRTKAVGTIAITAPSVAVARSVYAATAATAFNDPSRMILRQADVGGGQYEADDDLDDYLERPLQAAGLSGRVATYLGATYSDSKGFLRVSGIVLTVSSAADARKTFAIVTKASDRFAKRAANPWARVSLPAYGDQQRALLDPPDNEGIANAELVVRKKTTVWLLYVTLERRPKPPVSELVADLKRFATKQKARVGPG